MSHQTPSTKTNVLELIIKAKTVTSVMFHCYSSDDGYFQPHNTVRNRLCTMCACPQVKIKILAVKLSTANIDLYHDKSNGDTTRNTTRNTGNIYLESCLYVLKSLM